MYVYVCTCTCTCMCIHVHARVYMHVYMYVCTCTCTCVHVLLFCSDTSGRRSNQLKKQKAIDGEQEVVANEGEELHNDDDDDDNNNMTDELKDSIKCIQDHRKELGVAIIQCLHAAKPDVITKSAFGFGTTINNRVFHATYQGTLPCIESNGWTLLFR